MTATLDPLNSANYPGDGPLRPGGVSVSDTPREQKDLPSTPSPAVKAQAHALQVVRDVWDGNERVKRARTTYLPQAPGEPTANYDNRLARSVFFNVFRHTVDGLVGFVFRKDPQLGEDVPPAIRGDESGKGGHWENIDNAGTHGDVFARDLMQDAMTTGHAAILVDYPNTQGQALSLGDEQARKIRPYWLPIKKDNIVSWRTTVEDGRLILTQLVLQEITSVPDGAFGEKPQTRYRVLYRNEGVVGYQLLEIGEDKKTVIEVERGLYANQVEIPVAEVTTSGKVSLFVSDPPLVDLAALNIAHYQGWSDYANSLHKTCVPVFFTAGVTNGEDATFVISPDAGINATNPSAKAEYVSHSGEALGACKGALDDLKQDMASLGIAMLASEKRVAETAEAKRIGKADTDSALSVTARGLQDAIERALDFHARYLRLDDGGSITINRDFEDMTMPADLMVAYATLAEKLSLPVRVILEALQEGGRIPPDANLDELEQEIAANAAAAADEARQQAADAHAMQMEAKGLPPKKSAVKVERDANGKVSRLTPED